MTQEQTLVSVSYRGIPLFSQSVLEEVDNQGGFIQTDSPMPVGTELLLTPQDMPDLDVPVRVAAVMELRKSQRGKDAPQPGMRLTFEGEVDRILAYLEKGSGEAFELDAEPPELPEDEETRIDVRPPISTEDFVSKPSEEAPEPPPSEEPAGKKKGRKKKKGKRKKR